MRHLAPTHISLPSRILTLSRCSSNTESEPESGPSTPLPHTPLPYEGVPLDFDTDRIREAINLSDSSVGKAAGSKRSREDPELQQADWTDEELEVVQATLRHPFRPLSSAFPPGELPGPAIIDEITNQILAYAFRGSPNSTPPGDGWLHGWDATRKKVYNAALEASRVAHGIEKEKLPRAERVSRPGLRRMDSMDFLDQAESSTSVGAAIRLSTSLQNSAKLAAPSSVQPTSSSATDLDCQSTISSSSSASLLPAQPALSGPPLRRRSSQRSILNRPARPTSLLQRGKSYTANELQAEGSISPRSPHQPDLSSVSAQRLPQRITRSQSSVLASKPPPHALRDSFMNSNKSPVLERSLTLEIRTSPPSWSDSEDEDAKPKRSRAVAKKPQLRVQSVDIASSNLRSPFEEKNSFL